MPCTTNSTTSVAVASASKHGRQVASLHVHPPSSCLAAAKELTLPGHSPITAAGSDPPMTLMAMLEPPPSTALSTPAAVPMLRDRAHSSCPSNRNGGRATSTTPARDVMQPATPWYLQRQPGQHVTCVAVTTSCRPEANMVAVQPRTATGCLPLAQVMLLRHPEQGPSRRPSQHFHCCCSPERLLQQQPCKNGGHWGPNEVDRHGVTQREHEECNIVGGLQQEQGAVRARLERAVSLAGQACSGLQTCNVHPV